MFQHLRCPDSIERYPSSIEKGLSACVDQSNAANPTKQAISEGEKVSSSTGSRPTTASDVFEDGSTSTSSSTSSPTSTPIGLDVYGDADTALSTSSSFPCLAEVTACVQDSSSGGCNECWPGMSTDVCGDNSQTCSDMVCMGHPACVKRKHQKHFTTK